MGVLDCESSLRFLPGVGVEDWEGIDGGRFGEASDDLRSVMGDSWKEREREREAGD